MNIKSKKEQLEKEKAIEPYIEIDGGYARCVRCREDLKPWQEYCSCGQKQDWSWLRHS